MEIRIPSLGAVELIQGAARSQHLHRVRRATVDRVAERQIAGSDFFFLPPIP